MVWIILGIGVEVLSTLLFAAAMIWLTGCDTIQSDFGKHGIPMIHLSMPF